MAQMPNFQSAPQSDPFAMLGQMAGLQRYQQQGDEQRKAKKQQELLASVAQEAPDDPDSWVTMLNQRGAPDLALNLQSSLLKSRQEQAALQKTQLENNLTRFERGSAIASSITDEPSFQRGKMLIAQTLGPELAQHLGEQYDPAVVQQATQWGTTETGRLTAQRDAMSAYQEALKLEASNKRDAPETAKKWTEAVGQMLSVARNPEEWSSLMQMAKVSGAPPAILAAMPPEFTPEAPQLAAALAMTPEARASVADAAVGRAIQQGQLDVSKGQLGVAQGQLGVARDRLGMEKAEAEAKATASPSTPAKFAAAMPVLNAIDELSKKINTGSGAMARVAGAARSGAAAANMDDDVAEYEALIKGFTPLVARALGHTGVLTEQDVQSARALFPKPGDSQTLRDRKIKRVRALFAEMQSAETPSGPVGQPGLISLGAAQQGMGGGAAADPLGIR